MTKLFPIPMMGQGTADVESLSSYLFRSAYLHGVSVKTLLNAMNEFSESNLKIQLNRPISKSLIIWLAGVSEATTELRARLGEFTGHDMSCKPLDFLNLKVYGLNTEIGEFRWCPECLAEMHRIGAPLYYKQIWHMSIVKHCPVHRVRLVELCHKCHWNQTSFKAFYPVGYCTRCGESLFKRRTPLLQSDILPSWECPNHDFLEIFEKTANFVPEKTRFFGTEFVLAETRLFGAKFFPKLDGEYASSRKTLYFQTPDAMKVREQCRLNWKAGFRLQSLRRLAYFMNISLYELLNFNGNLYTLPLAISEVEAAPKNPNVRIRATQNHQPTYHKVVAYIKEQETPPSLKQVALFAKVSTGYLKFRFPSLARQIVENYQNSRLQKSLENRYRAQTAAFQYFTDGRYASHGRTKTAAYSALRDETGLPKRLLIHSIQTAYEALQVGHLLQPK